VSKVAERGKYEEGVWAGVFHMGVQALAVVGAGAACAGMLVGVVSWAFAFGASSPAFSTVGR
jgi:hypothetical protein